MVVNLSIAIYVLPMHVLTLLSVKKILLLRYMNCSTYFRGLLFNEEVAPSWLKQMNSVSVRYCVLFTFLVWNHFLPCIVHNLGRSWIETVPMYSLQNSSDNVKKISVTIRWVNYCQSVFAEHYHGSYSFYGKTIC